MSRCIEKSTSNKNRKPKNGNDKHSSSIHTEKNLLKTRCGIHKNPTVRTRYGPWAIISLPDFIPILPLDRSPSHPRHPMGFIRDKLLIQLPGCT